MKYIIEIGATAEIVELWAVEADSPEAARAQWDEHGADHAQMIGDASTGEERDREILNVHAAGEGGDLFALMNGASANMLALLRDIASIIDTTDSEHPAFMDSGADSIALLWESNGRLRATIRQANGGAA